MESFPFGMAGCLRGHRHTWHIFHCFAQDQCLKRSNLSFLTRSEGVQCSHAPLLSGSEVQFLDPVAMHLSSQAAKSGVQLAEVSAKCAALEERNRQLEQAMSDQVGGSEDRRYCLSLSVCLVLAVIKYPVFGC